MGVASLRKAIAERADDLMPAVLVEAAVTEHKRHWRSCVCSWCSTKREATREIADAPGPREPRDTFGCMPPPYHAGYSFYRPTREDNRERLRQKYRGQLSRLEAE